MTPKLMINYNRKLNYVKIKSTTIKTFVIRIQYSLQQGWVGFLYEGQFIIINDFHTIFVVVCTPKVCRNNAFKVLACTFIKVILCSIFDHGIQFYFEKV